MKRLFRPQQQTTGVCKPQLTSLIDVMTILLVFLMKSFSVEGNLITPSNDLQLPVSISTEIPQPVATLEITSQAIMVHGESVVKVSSFINNDSLLISPLSKWLLRHHTTNLNEIMLQADRHIPFTVIKRVMYTCSKAGYDDFTILVQQEG